MQYIRYYQQIGIQKKIKEVKEEFTDLYKKDKIISYLNEIRIN